VQAGTAVFIGSHLFMQFRHNLQHLPSL
jgi:hypothetical protein